MEESIGKRISAHRKRLGITQDALAEQLGVTAQAVSKWENDQSCPDITTLPRLAEIFCCTTDSLLGLEEKKVHTEKEESQPAEEKLEESPVQDGLWELQWNAGRKSSVGIALWLLITGSLALASTLQGWGIDLWHILWSSGLMILGFMGLLRRFSVLRLAAFLSGGYFLLWHIGVLPDELTILRWDVMIPGAILLFGLCLLADSFRKPSHSRFRIARNGHTLVNPGSQFSCEEDTFICTTTFGENHHLITLPELVRGHGELSFGELEVDLRGCESFAPGCTVDLSCAFGELTLILPKHCRAETNISTAFAASDVHGAPDPNADTVIYVNGRVSFGEITLRYL